jgi:hypothetical protein
MQSPLPWLLSWLNAAVALSFSLRLPVLFDVVLHLFDISRENPLSFNYPVFSLMVALSCIIHPW